MVTKTHRWTRADLANLPDDGNRYEVLDGELFVTPQAAFRHQRIAVELTAVLRGYCLQHALGVAVGPGSVQWDENELQPDIEVFPGRYDLADDSEWEELPRPILVVEVLSDSTRRRDQVLKREAYARRGIPSYWIVDPRLRTVTVWTLESGEAEVVQDRVRWQPLDNLAPLELPLSSIFGRAPSA